MTGSRLVLVDGVPGCTSVTWFDLYPHMRKEFLCMKLNWSGTRGKAWLPSLQAAKLLSEGGFSFMEVGYRCRAGSEEGQAEADGRRKDLHVSGFAKEPSQEHVRKIFQQYGTITGIRLYRTYAFVTFASVNEAWLAKRRVDGTYCPLVDTHLLVRYGTDPARVEARSRPRSPTRATSDAPAESDRSPPRKKRGEMPPPSWPLELDAYTCPEAECDLPPPFSLWDHKMIWSASGVH